MLRIHGILAHRGDLRHAGRLHALEHAGAVECLWIPPGDLGRRRFRLPTDRGTDCAFSLGRGEAMADGDLLYLDETRAVILRLGAEAVLRLRPRDADAALKLGWNAGNLHWRVRFGAGTLDVLLDAPVDSYRARIAPLLISGEVDEADAAQAAAE